MDVDNVSFIDYSIRIVFGLHFTNYTRKYVY